MSLLQFTNKGIYCAEAGVYLDPWRSVEKAIISHGHSDHARWGMKNYLSTPITAAIMKHRIGTGIKVETREFGESFTINGVKFSLHPAGHILGSAQIRVEHKGEVAVFSGDYKVASDAITLPFEPIQCHTFITESTFGLPVYRWQPEDVIFEAVNNWWRLNQTEGITSILCGYSLGKAQRIISGLDTTIGRIYTHGAVENINEVLRGAGVDLPATIRVTREIDKSEFKGQMIIAPPSVIGDSWLNKFKPYKTAVASGWMAVRGSKRRRNSDVGFALSDHADWPGLNQAIDETRAEKIIVTHGYTDIFSTWLQERGLDAVSADTAYSNDGDQGDEVEDSKKS